MLTYFKRNALRYCFVNKLLTYFVWVYHFQLKMLTYFKRRGKINNTRQFARGSTTEAPRDTLTTSTTFLRASPNNVLILISHHFPTFPIISRHFENFDFFRLFRAAAAPADAPLSLAFSFAHVADSSRTPLLPQTPPKIL